MNVLKKNWDCEESGLAGSRAGEIHDRSPVRATALSRTQTLWELSKKLVRCLDFLNPCLKGPAGTCSPFLAMCVICFAATWEVK